MRARRARQICSRGSSTCANLALIEAVTIRMLARQAITSTSIGAREMLLKMPHPAIGTYLTTGLAAKLSETPGHITRPPLLGEHTEEVLRANGFTFEEIAKLREAKAIK